MQQTNKRATRNGVARHTRLLEGVGAHIRRESVQLASVIGKAHEIIIVVLGRQLDELTQLAVGKLLEIDRYMNAAPRFVFIAHTSIIARREGGAACL